MKLFDYLPETLFQPLAGPKKHIYARLLIRLYERVFAARVLETPTREDIIRYIALALPEAGVNSSDELREDDAESDGNPHAPTSPITGCATPDGWSKNMRNGMCSSICTPTRSWSSGPYPN